MHTGFTLNQAPEQKFVKVGKLSFLAHMFITVKAYKSQTQSVYNFGGLCPSVTAEKPYFIFCIHIFTYGLMRLKRNEIEN